MDRNCEKLLGIIVEDLRPFEAAPEPPFFFLQPLLKKGFTEEELSDLIEKLKKQKIIVKDSVVGDGEFDRVVEIDYTSLLRAASPQPKINEGRPSPCA